MNQALYAHMNNKRKIKKKNKGNEEEMTQALYAHMNNKTIKKKKEKEF
jgi:hypothetical protein